MGAGKTAGAEVAATSPEIPNAEQAAGVPNFGDAFALARIATGVVLAGVLPLWVAALLPLVGLDAAVHPFRLAGAALAIPGVMIAVGAGRRPAAAVALVFFVGGAALLAWSEPLLMWGPGPGTWAWGAVAVLLLWAPVGEELRLWRKAELGEEWRWPQHALPLAWALLVAAHVLDAAAGGPERWIGLAVAAACALPWSRRAGWTAGLGLAILMTGFGVEPFLHAAIVCLHLLVADESWWPRAAPSEPHPVIFFDGVCGLCNHSVDWVLRRDPAGVFLFAPLQWDTAESVLGTEKSQALDGVILRDEDGVHEGSTAVLRILDRLGGAWRPFAALRVIPRPLRDVGYRFVAKRRYAWFGVKEECRIPTPEERARFLA